MAQRVFLVQIPKSDLERAAAAICGDSTARRDFTADLAARSAAHLRRVTASERVADAARRSAGDSEALAFARNCLPFLLAARNADAILGALNAVTKIEDVGELEDFFVEQARALGIAIDELDRQKFVEPEAPLVQAWIHDQIEKAADLRVKALGPAAPGEPDPVADYAISTWVWLARIFARARPSFWQGRDRWLGGAAFPESFTIRTNVTSIRSPKRQGFVGRLQEWLGTAREAAANPELARLVARSQAQTRKQLAKHSVQELRNVLVSAANLCPALALPDWETALPKEGGGNLASGAVPHDRLDDLVGVLRRAQSAGDLPYDDHGNDWAELVVAAARAAKNSDAHLVEGDDSIYGAYRWPPIERR